MSKIRKRKTLLLTMVLAVLALCAMGAQADDVEIDFTRPGASDLNLIASGATAGNWRLRGIPGGSKLGGGTLNWAAHVVDAGVNSTMQIRFQPDRSRLQLDTGSNNRGQGAGSFILLDFGLFEVSNFFRTEFDANNKPFFFRFMIRETDSNKWYVSDEINSTGAVLAYSDTDNWTEVTASAEAMGLNLAVPASSSPAVFPGTNLTISGSPGDISTGITVDRACIYLTRKNATSDINISLLAFRSTIPGATKMPDVRNMTEAEARAFLDAKMAGFTPLVYAADTVPSTLVENDVFDKGSVTSQVPAVGSLLVPGETVIFTVSNGMQNSWAWTGGAGDGKFENAANWSVVGFFDPVQVADGGLGGRREINPANWPPLAPGNRLLVANGDTVTLDTGTFLGHNITVCGGSTLIIKDAGVLDCSQQGIDKTSTLVNAGSSHIGRLGGEAINLSGGDNTNADGTLIIKNGGTFKTRRLYISTAVARGVGTGHLVVEKGGIWESSPGRLDIGTTNADSGPSVGILEIVGMTTATFAGITADDVDLRTSGSILRFTADAEGFGTFDIPLGEFRILDKNAIIEIDASLLEDTTNPSTHTLVSGRQVTDIVAGYDFVNNVIVTPPAGSSKAEWSVIKYNTDGDPDKDGLALLRNEVVPAELSVSPATDLTLNAISLSNGESASSVLITVTNTGGAELYITGLTITGDQGFALVSPTLADLPVELRSSAAFGDSLLIEVGFDTGLLSNPSSAGNYTGTLTIESDAPGAASTGINLMVDVLAGKRLAAIKPETWMLYED